MMTLSLGYSPCPNDTFMFYGLSSGAVRARALAFSERLEDVETLNVLASQARLDVTKISCAAFAHLSGDYCLLHTGAALGRGCGPLVVSRQPRSLESLATSRVAMPGRHTTASLLFALYGPSNVRPLQMAFHQVMPAVAAGRAEAGVIIHEGRFTYPAYGLSLVCDLGQLWEQETHLPLPLGVIAARRALGAEAIGRIEAAIRESIRYGRQHEAQALQHARRFAQEMADDVLRAHIDLYVNDFSVDIGQEGAEAILTLLARGAEAGALPRPDQPPFLT